MVDDLTLLVAALSVQGRWAALWHVLESSMRTPECWWFPNRYLLTCLPWRHFRIL